MDRTTTEVMEDHLTRRLQGDVDGDIATNFSPGIIILSTFGVFRGHDGVHASAKKLADLLGEAVFSYDLTMIEDNYAFLEWSGTSGAKIVHDGADSFFVRSGRIVLQTIHYTAAHKRLPTTLKLSQIEERYGATKRHPRHGLQ